MTRIIKSPTLRALSASPLMVGGDLPTMDGFSLRLITDPDMLACNQNGVMGKHISRNDGVEVWKTPEKGNDKKGWAGIFNRTDRLKSIFDPMGSFFSVTNNPSLFTS